MKSITFKRKPFTIGTEYKSWVITIPKEFIKCGLINPKKEQKITIEVGKWTKDLEK